MLRIFCWFFLTLLFIWITLFFLSRKLYAVDFGVSFSHRYAAELGLNPEEVYAAILTDLKPKKVRLAAHWDEIEKTKGVYDFSALDHYMNESAKQGANVILTVGQKVPRWPECFVPEWFLPDDPVAKEVFLAYVKEVVLRYQHHPALEFWQVENEPFIRFPFGQCGKYREAWVGDEVALVKTLDTTHPVIITDSGEIGTWKKAATTGDYFGTTLYRIVRLPNGMRWGYWWVPGAVYRIKAILLGVTLPEKFFISELQAEPWFDSGGPQNTPLARQYETMTVERFTNHILVAKQTGASRAYLWGVEWWYWLKTVHGDASMWDAGKAVLQ